MVWGSKSHTWLRVGFIWRLVKHSLLGRMPRIWNLGWGLRICIYNKFHVLLMLLILGLYFENHWIRMWFPGVRWSSTFWCFQEVRIGWLWANCLSALSLQFLLICKMGIKRSFSQEWPQWFSEVMRIKYWYLAQCLVQSWGSLCESSSFLLFLCIISELWHCEEPRKLPTWIHEKKSKTLIS